MLCHLPSPLLFNDTLKRNDVFKLLRVYCCVIGPQLDIQLQKRIIIIIALSFYFIYLS